MKTYDVLSTGTYQATGPQGAWVKTSDHFEAVAAYEEKCAQLVREIHKENARYHQAMSQLSALVEQLSKGVAAQAPGDD